MKSNHNPSLQDRLSGAAKSRQKALDQLRSKPPVDEKIVAAREAARIKREAAQTEKRTAKLAKDSAIAAEKAAEPARAEAAAAPPTAAELKASRDARYAARKSRR